MKGKPAKRIMFLGGATFQLPPIEHARSQGYFTIVCDMNGDCPAAQLAHKFYNISTTDGEEVLRVAEKEQIDGILTCGSDVSAPAVAFVSEHMGLPGNSFDSVSALTDKGRFRALLSDHEIQSLPFRVFEQCDSSDIDSLVNDIGLPVVVKPVDSSGSKGISIVSNSCDLTEAVQRARNAARSYRIVIEKYVARSGLQICGDAWVDESRIVFAEFGDGHCYDDGAHLAPFAETFPSSHRATDLEALVSVANAALRVAGFDRGAINIDAIIDSQGRPFILEIGPRSGGNFIPQVIRYRRRVDLIAAAVEASWNPFFELRRDVPHPDLCFASYMLHSLNPGVLRDVEFASEIRPFIVQHTPYLSAGDTVEPFTQANAAVGNLILRFDSSEQMHEIIRGAHDYCRVQLHESAALMV